MEKKINRSKHRRDKLLNGVIKNFFTPSETEKFNKRLLSGNKTPFKIKLSKSTSLKAKEINKQSEIDLLITFAQKTFEKPKYLEFLQQLGQYCVTTGNNNQAQFMLENVVNETKGKSCFEKIYADAALALGEMHSRQALWKLCVKYIKMASAAYKKINDIKGYANSENLLGTTYLEQSKTYMAIKHFEKGLSLLNSSDCDMIAKIENNIAITYLIPGNYDSALMHFNKALYNADKAGDLKQGTNIHLNLGILYTDLDLPEKAFVELDKGINFGKKINLKLGIANGYALKAYLFIKQKDFSLAESLTDEALEISNKINSKVGIADAYKLKGIIQRNFRNYPLAEYYFLTSIRICKGLKNEWNGSEAEYELGVLYLEKGQLVESKKHFLKALKYYKRIKAKKQIDEIERYLKNIFVF